MGYSYQPKFPKAKLHETVTKYRSVMATLGKARNCSGAFVGADGSPGPARVPRWLPRHPRHEADGNRCALLANGDVWREVEPLRLSLIHI